MSPCISEEAYNRFIEDALSKEELVSLEQHILECQDCHVEFAKWKSLKESLTEVLTVEVPDYFKAKVMDRVRHEKIIHVEQPLSFKRKMTAVMLLMLTVVYYFFPFLKPFTTAFTNEAISYLSELGYNLLNFAGLDIKTVFTFFRAFISLFNELLIVFTLGTFMLIVGFFSLILGGKAKLKAN